jgi:hypothetical protein
MEPVPKQWHQPQDNIVLETLQIQVVFKTTISLRSKPKICMTDRDAQDSGASEQGFIAKEDE